MVSTTGALVMVMLVVAGCRSTTKGEVIPDAAGDQRVTDGPVSGADGAPGGLDGRFPDSPADTGAGGADATAADATATDVADVASSDAGSLECGAMTCGAGQICVRECTCGGAPLCTPRPDGGTCPGGPCPGSTLDMCGPFCENPPPACRNLPAECNGTPSDACLVGKVCPGIRSGRRLDCVCPP